MNWRDLRQILDIQDRIEKSSQALERLKTGALVAFTGGALSLALLAGSIFWIPLSMSGALLIYRIVLAWAEYPRWRQTSRLETWDSILTRIEKLEGAKISTERKHLLVSALEQELEPNWLTRK